MTVAVPADESARATGDAAGRNDAGRNDAGRNDAGRGDAARGDAGRGAANRLALFLVGGALLSKVLGLVREVLVARAIGTSMIADALRGSQTATLLPLLFLQSESVPAILIPTYREWHQAGTAPRRYGALCVALAGIGLVLAVLVGAFAEPWIDVLLAGFGTESRAVTLAFTRVMVFAMPASVLLAAISGCEIALGQSRITAIRATLTNVAVIGGIGVFLVTGDPVVLAWSFTAAFNLTASWALWRATRSGVLEFRGLRLGEVWSSLAFYLRRLRPLLLQPVGENALIWVERLLASGLAVGTLASLDYARTLTDCAVLLVSQPIGLAVLSYGVRGSAQRHVDSLARPVLALAVPVSIFVVVFAPEIVALVFRRGAFDAQAVESTSAILRGIGAGLWATTLGWIMIRMLNSAGRNRRATAIVFCAYLANIAVAAGLVGTLGGAALGAGEAVRGLVILFGVAAALGGLRHLFGLLAAMAPVAAVLVPIQVAIQVEAAGVLPRLLAGAAVTAVAMAITLPLLVPEVRLSLLARVRRA